MEIFINDRPLNLPEGTTLSHALENAKIATEGIATAVNEKVVSRDERDSFILSEGDRIIIIHAFYGG